MADDEGHAHQVRVRPAAQADDAAVSRLAGRTFSAADGADGADGDAGPGHDPLPPLGVVAESDGRVIAAASARLRGQWFGGRRMLCAAVGGVAVDREARGLGVGRAVMSALLGASRQAGAVTSALIPSTHRFYASLGYGVGGRRPVFALATSELRGLATSRQTGLKLRRTQRGDAAAVAALVRRRAVRGSGLLDHSGLDETVAEDPTGPDSYVGEVDGHVVGWCLLHRQQPSSRLAHFDLVVQDLVADEPEVELVLWRLLVGDHPSALRAEGVVPAGSVLEHRLERQQDVAEGASWMLSLLDVDAALAARGYPVGLTAELVLSVADPVRPENDGRRRLLVSGGTAVVQAAPDAVPDAEVTVSDLASMFTAHLDPVEAQRQGRLHAADPDVAATLRALMAGPPAWLSRPF